MGGVGERIKKRRLELGWRGKKEFAFAGLRSKFDDDSTSTYGARVKGKR